MPNSIPSVELAETSAKMRPMLEALRQARVRATAGGTSVNALVRDFIEDYASGIDLQRTARQRIIELAHESTASSGGRTWTRGDLYD
ncbi:MAG: hypothetical protein ACTH1Z_11765 [Ancrocorticia sp.]|uniref:hypothetical protein n=1 Tax=Ancrocorticia sp. TaxID=2593684 RepID=UPI003F8EDEA9